MCAPLLALLCAAFPCTAPLAPAQAGDKPGEAQPAVDKRFEVPPAPALSPEQAMAAFRLAPGYRIELAAAEPLINDPVVISWDAHGRMWVVEMTQLMLNPDGDGELEPKCTIAVLSDRDRDGRFDHRQVFLDGLVLPRAVCPVPGGVLAVLPPEIVFLQDLDGDGRADRREVVDGGIEAGLHNPEHAANGLTLGLDNWVYLANHGKRYRRVDGRWISQPVASGGQWGLSQDDWGRLAFNYNSSTVHGNLVPPHYLVRNRALGRAEGGNARLVDGPEVFPIRLNTGVNRGYQAQTLRADGTLKNYTGACGPLWFTGTALHEEDRGNLFSCEPCANLVRMNRMTEIDGRPQGRSAWADQRQEFLASTDERFRPVNLSVGPDGALYVVDLYRGILQHRVFMTSFLRRQVEERGLDQPVGLGRIWRVTASDRREYPEVIDLHRLPPAQWVEQFHQPNSWNRLRAQSLLVAHGPTPDLIDRLRRMVGGPPARDRATAIARCHALWTLEAWSALDPALVSGRLRSESDAKLLTQWLRVAEAFLDDPTVFMAIAARSTDAPREVAWQIVLSLGESKRPESLALLLHTVSHHGTDSILRSAALSGLGDREEEALVALLGPGNPYAWSGEAPWQAKWVEALARCCANGARGDAVAACFNLAAGLGDHWAVAAILGGLQKGLPKKEGQRRFARPRPVGLDLLFARKGSPHDALVNTLEQSFTWQVPAAEAPVAADSAYQAILARGSEIYAISCGACHQLDGRGLPGLAPPFEGSEWLQKTDAELAGIALYGLSGPIQVAGQEWNLNMPGWPHLSDADLAAVLTYIRHHWGEQTEAFPPSVVAKRRADGQ